VRRAPVPRRPSYLWQLDAVLVVRSRQAFERAAGFPSFADKADQKLSLDNA
jgi:hypothetical protein